MLEIVETNAAAILTMIALWSTVTWAFTYMYMANKQQKKQEVIDFLDTYIEECHSHQDGMADFISWQDRRILELEGHTCLNDLNSICVPCEDEAARIYAEQGGQ